MCSGNNLKKQIVFEALQDTTFANLCPMDMTFSKEIQPELKVE